MRIRRLIGSIVLYTLYAIVVFFAVLYLTFPYDTLRERWSEALQQRGMRLTMSPLRPTLLLGLRTNDVRLQLDAQETNQVLLHLQTLHVHPEWRDLIAGKFQAGFEATLYNGRIDGKLRYIGGEQHWAIETQMANLDIAQHPLLRKQNKALFTGKLHGTTTIALNSEGQIRDGAVNWQVQPLVFTGKQELQLPLQQDITCDTVKLDVKFVTGQPNNMALTCQGNDLMIDTRGTVGWQSPLPASEVNLRWQIHSDNVYKQEMTLIGSLIRRPPDRRGDLTFRMQGPLRQLRYGA